MRQGGPVQLDGLTSVQANRWYHVAVTKDDEAVTLYVNGKMESRKPLGQRRDGLEVGSSPMDVGRARDRRSFLHGKLDEILLYNRALSEDEVRRLHQMRESGPCKI